MDSCADCLLAAPLSQLLEMTSSGYNIRKHLLEVSDAGSGVRVTNCINVSSCSRRRVKVKELLLHS